MNNLAEIIDFETNNILVEFKTKFSLQKFKSIDGILNKTRYVSQHLKYLGKGSARVAFLLSNRFVLKLAKFDSLERGISQNKAEVEIYTEPQLKSIVTKIYDFDSNYEWIVLELVKPLANKKEFEKYSNVNYEIFDKIKNDIILQNIKHNIKKELLVYYNDIVSKLKLKKNINFDEIIDFFESIINSVKHNNFIHNIFNLLEKYKLEPADIMRYQHWAKTSDNRIVLFDYGLTNEIWYKYYE